MPGMDGETLGQMIKADAELKQTRLIMLTSMGQRTDEQRFLEAGLEAFIVKPTRQSQLFDTLASVLGTAQNEGQPSSVDPSEEKASNVPAAEPEPALHARILLAEDNMVNQKVAVRMLEKLGCRVDVAANGKEAVEMLAQMPYDLVFIDCQMPEMRERSAYLLLR